MNELLIILLSWASYLSGYPCISNGCENDLVDVQFKEHSFFVENVCGGVECNVMGWYDDKDIVYIDNSHKNFEEQFASSLLVHEFVHYLQHKSNNFSSSCKDSLAREREAYYVQNKYIVEVLATASLIKPAPIRCRK